ncbi:MAG: 50S ribosomal protein L11 methyltransferase [Polyangiales bacterium]
MRRENSPEVRSNRAYVQSLCVLGGALELRSLPLCPELRLWLLHDGVDLNACVPELLNGGSAPYWAFCWGAGQALARYILDHPALVRGQRIVDFGAGSAVAGIAALQAGAAHVTAVDIDHTALRIAECNAAENGVELAVAEQVPDDWDVLLASDVLYETGNEHWLSHAATSGKEVLLADPMRHGTARPGPAMTVVAEYAVRTLPDVDYPIGRALVHRLRSGG